MDIPEIDDDWGYPYFRKPPYDHFKSPNISNDRFMVFPLFKHVQTICPEPFSTTEAFDFL